MGAPGGRAVPRPPRVGRVLRLGAADRSSGGRGRGARPLGRPAPHRWRVLRGAVVAEDQVEARIGEREFLRAPANEREPDAGRLEVRTGGSELVRAEVQACDASAAHRDLDPELAGTASELQRVYARNIAERA